MEDRIIYNTLESALRDECKYSYYILLSIHDSYRPRFFWCPMNMVGEAIKKKPYLHEILGVEGRIVIDIDIPPCSAISPEDAISKIELLIITVLSKMIGMKKASILRKESIQWDNTERRAYPFGWANNFRNDKWSFHLTLPFWADERTHISSLLYRMINEEAKKDPFFFWIDGDLVDVAIAGKNHSLRLSGCLKKDSDERKRLSAPNIPIDMMLSRIPRAFIHEDLILDIEGITIHPMIELLSFTASSHNIEKPSVDTDQIWDTLQKECDYLQDIDGLRRHKPTCDSDMGISMKAKQGINCYNCPICRRIHDNSDRTPILHVRGNSLVFDCWRRIERKDTACSPIQVSIDVSYLDKYREKLYQQRLDLAFSLYTERPNTTYRDQVGEWRYIPDLPLDVGTIGIKGAMSSGKSTAIRRFIEQNEGKSILWIGPKVSFDQEVYKNMIPYGFTMYSSRGDLWVNAHRLIVQHESLRRCEKDRYDIIILDEVESLWSGYTGRTIEGKEFSTSIALCRYVSLASTVITADAFLSPYTWKHVKSLRPMHSSSLISNTKPYDNRSCIEYTSKDGFRSEICNDKGNKFIVSASIKEAEDIAVLLASHGEKTIILTGIDREGDVRKVENLIIGERDTSLWDKVQNVVITPTVTIGISFDKVHFDTLYIYGCRGSCNPRDLVQMCYRVRHFRSDKVGLFLDERVIPSQIDYHAFSFKQHYDRMERGWELFKECNSQPGIVSAWRNGSLDQKYIYTHSQVLQSLGQLCYTDLTRKMMSESLGWTMSVCNEESAAMKIDKDIVHGVALKERSREKLSEYVNIDKWPLLCKRKTGVTKMLKVEDMHSVAKTVKGMSRCKIDPVRIENLMDKTTYHKYHWLKELFKIGGLDLHNMPEECSLSYISDPRLNKQLDTILEKMNYSWNMKISSRYKWKGIEEFLKERVICLDVERVGGKVNKQDIYSYKFKWVWNDVCINYIPFKKMNDVYIRVDDYVDGDILLPDLYEGIQQIPLLDNEAINDYGYIM